MDKIIFIFQLSFVVHFATSFILLFVTRNDPISGELFIQPNEFLGKTAWVPRLLRAEHFMLWRSAPNGMVLQPFLIKALFWVSRLAGACAIISILGFFIGAFVVSGGHA